MGLTRLAIVRPVFMLMLMLLCVFGGYRAYQGMRKEENPDVEFGTATITTIYPGAGPDEMNTLVSRKIEDAVAGIPGLIELTSTSQEGASVVVMQFEVGTNMDAALGDIRSKVDGVSGNLPSDAERPVVEKFSFTASPVLSLAVSSTSLSPRELRDLVDDKLRDRFSQIPGVAQVGVFGGDIREIQVRILKDKLSAFGIGIIDVQRAIQAAALNVPSGRITTATSESSVRMISEFRDLDDIRNTIISIQDPDQRGPAALVRLGDIADVRDTEAERRIYSRVNGADSITLTIQKTKEGNSLTITDAAKKLLPSLKSEFNVDFVTTFESARVIKESLFDLNLTIFIGVLLVAFIVYLFLHNFRGTLIVAIAIPVCLFATLMIYQLLGFTINNLSLLALSLAVGVLVDDAIVVLENIYRHLKMGEDPIDAAINGRAEIGLAAIAITLADVVVFLPVGFMGGIVGQFFRPLGIGFAVAVMLSLFVSFTITPMLASRWYKKGEDAEAMGGKLAHSFERVFGKFERAYKRALQWSIQHRWFTFSAGWVALVGLIMFIVGGFSGPSTAMTGFSLGLIGSIVIFTWLYFARRFGAKRALAGLVGLIVLANIVGGATGKGPMPVLGGGIVILALIAIVLNIGRKYATYQLLLGGLFFGAVLAVAGVGGHLYKTWKGSDLFSFQFFPLSDAQQVNIGIQLPPGASLAETERVAQHVEKAVKDHPEAKYTVTRIGSKGTGLGASDQGANFAQVDVTLYEKAALLDSIAFWVKHEERLRRVKATKVQGDMLAAIGRVPGAQINVSTGEQQGFGAAIQISLRSDDRALLEKTALGIRDKLAEGAIEGVINVDSSSKPGKPELRAIPDRARLADAGLGAAELGLALRTMYEGNDQTKFRVRGREYDVRVLLDEVDKNNPDLIGQVPVAFRQGNPIYLDSVARIENTTALDKVERRTRQEEIRITAGLLPGLAAGSKQAEIDKWLQDNKLIPEGVTQKNLGQADVQAREGQYLMSALLVGFILVYALLASLYNNLLYPFIIQLAQPQAMIGAILALVLTDKPLTIIGFIGIIALVGLVGKNAILLVDYTNTLRERGMNREDAILEAGPTRLRPIMMTSLAVILGMLPVALAVGRGSEFRETIGIIIIGGIALSTLLTLLVIPCSYTIFDDMVKKKNVEPEEAAPSA